MRAWGLSELVSVSRVGSGDWPEEFTWRGRRRRVRKIEAFAEGKAAVRGVSSGWLRKFRLNTEDGLSCVLSHDRRRNRWIVEALFTTQRGG